MQPEFIPHSLRHLYASTSLAEGIPITEVSRWLGHKSIEVTHQIYGHLVPSSFDRARTTLDAAFHKNQPPAATAESRQLTVIRVGCPGRTIRRSLRTPASTPIMMFRQQIGMF